MAMDEISVGLKIDYTIRKYLSDNGYVSGNVSGNSTVNTASYIIYKSGSTTNALNGTTGAIDYSDTDATTVIQSAINQTWDSYGGGTIIIREGTYTINSKITFKPVNLIGSGRNKTILIAKNSLNSIMIEAYGYINSTFDYYKAGMISNLSIDGNRSNQTSGDGIILARCQYTILDNLNIQNVFGYGIKLLRDYWCQISNISMYNCGNGIKIGAYSSDGTYMPGGTPGDLFSNQNILINVRVEGGVYTLSYPTNYGIHIASGSSNNLYNCDTSSCAEGIHIETDANADHVYQTNIFCHYFEDDGVNGMTGVNIVSAGIAGTRYTYIHAPGFFIAGTHIADNTGSYTLMDTVGDNTLTGGIYAPRSVFYTIGLKSGGLFNTPLWINSAIDSEIPQTILTGTTAGSITWSMPFQGISYKKFIAYSNGYNNTTGSSQTITYPTAFTNTPKLVVNDVTGTTTSNTTLTLPNSMGGPITGWIIVEGY